MDNPGDDINLNSSNHNNANDAAAANGNQQLNDNRVSENLIVDNQPAQRAPNGNQNGVYNATGSSLLSQNSENDQIQQIQTNP